MSHIEYPSEAWLININVFAEFYSVKVKTAYPFEPYVRWLKSFIKQVPSLPLIQWGIHIDNKTQV